MTLYFFSKIKQLGIPGVRIHNGFIILKSCPHRVLLMKDEGFYTFGELNFYHIVIMEYNYASPRFGQCHFNIQQGNIVILFQFNIQRMEFILCLLNSSQPFLFFFLSCLLLCIRF